MERRTRYDIYQDILETVRRRGATGITRISYGANLPVDRAKEAAEFLVQRASLRRTITAKAPSTCSRARAASSSTL